MRIFLGSHRQSAHGSEHRLLAQRAGTAGPEVPTEQPVVAPAETPHQAARELLEQLAREIQRQKLQGKEKVSFFKNHLLQLTEGKINDVSIILHDQVAVPEIFTDVFKIGTPEYQEVLDATRDKLQFLKSSLKELPHTSGQMALNFAEGVTNTILPKRITESMTSAQKRAFGGAITMGTALFAGWVTYSLIKGKEAGQKQEGGIMRKAMWGLLIGGAAVIGGTYLADHVMERFGKKFLPKEIAEAGKNKAKEIWDKTSDNITGFLNGDKDKNEKKSSETRIDENEIEWMQAEAAIPLYWDAVRDSLHPFAQLLRKNREGIVVIAGTTMVISSDARNAVLNTAGTGKDSALTLLKFFRGTVKEHPILSVLSITAMLYGAKESRDMWIPKDPRHLQEFCKNQLAKAGDRMMDVESSLVQSIPPEDWIMIAGILRGSAEAKNRLVLRTRELFGNMAEGVTERLSLSPEELIATKNRTGLDVFVGFLEAIAMEHPELKEAVHSVRNRIGSISYPLTAEHIEQIRTLTHDFDLLIEEEGGVYVYRIQDEQGIWHTQTLCLNPVLSVPEQVAYARTFVIDRNDPLEMVNQLGLPLQQAREWAQYAFFSDVASEEDAGKKLQNELNSGGTIVVRSGIAYLYLAGEGAVKQYVIGPYEFTVKPLQKYLTGDFSAVELAVDYAEGLLPVFVLGATSSISRLRFAELLNGKVLLRSLAYPVTGTVSTGKLIGKSVITPLWQNIKDGRAWHTGVLEDPKNILVSGAKERIYRLAGEAQRKFIPGRRMKAIGFINRQISFLEEAKKLIALSRYSLRDTAYLEAAHDALIHSDMENAPTLDKLVKRSNLSSIDEEIARLTKRKQRIAKWRGGATSAEAGASAADDVLDRAAGLSRIPAKHEAAWAQVFDAIGENEDALRTLEHIEDTGDFAKFVEVVDEAGDATKAAQKFAVIGKVAKTLDGIAIVGDAFAIAFAGYEAYETHELLRRTPESSRELREKYAERYYYHKANAAIGGVGLVAGVVGLTATGTAAAVATPVALATLPVSASIAALYEKHKFEEGLVRNVEDWKREFDPEQSLADIRSLGFGEVVGQETRILLKDGNWIVAGATSGLPMLDLALQPLKERLYLWKSEGTRKGQQKEIDEMHRKRLKAIVEESGMIQVPVTVRDPHGGERPLNPAEVAYYDGCKKMYEEAKMRYLWENGQEILFSGGEKLQNLGRLLGAAESYARLQHEKYAMEHVQTITVDGAKKDTKDTLPSESLSSHDQAREYQITKEKQMLTGMFAIARSAIEQGDQAGAKEILTQKYLVPFFTEQSLPHILSFRVKIEETNFASFWADGNRGKLTELHALSALGNLIEQQAEKVADSVINTAAPLQSKGDVLEGLWNDLMRAESIIISSLENPKNRYEQLKADEKRFTLVEDYLKRQAEFEEANGNVAELRKQVASYGSSREAGGHLGAIRIQTRERLKRYEKILKEYPAWFQSNPL